MQVELINTGSELMLGFTLNTHQQWLCRRLADTGLVVTRQVAVADTGPAIQQTLQESFVRADLVITTGGLGPTSDDITRDKIAELLHLPLHEDPLVVGHIESFFAGRKRAMPASTRVQAMVPAGATVLMNRFGTAPGLVIQTRPGQFRAGSSLLVMLPGPPRELRPMFSDQVLPLLQTRMSGRPSFVCRVFRSTGLGESVVEEKINAPLRQLVAEGLDIGYCAHVGSVDLRLSARGDSAARIVAEAERIIQPLLSDRIFATGDEPLESVVVRLLTERRQTVSLAESCTGGLITHRITDVPGASAVLVAGLVTYSNGAKQEILGVRSETLEVFGAVSEESAREMAEGARARMKSDYAVAVTGIAGPTGGSEGKPVGTVFLAVTSETGTRVLKGFNPYDRETFKFATSQQALELLRRTILATENV